MLDANALLAREDPEWFTRFSNLTNIGRDIPRISFLFGLPELLWSLADPSADPPPPESMTADAGSATVELPKDLHARAEKVADLVLETGPAIVLLSTYISNHAFTCHLALDLRRKISRPDLFRVEPFTPMYTHAEKFGIDLETYTFPIPQPFLHMEKTISEMSVVWNHGMSARDRMFYAGKLKMLFAAGS